MKRVNRLHPGEILKMMYLEPMGLTVSKLSETLKRDRSGISELVNGKRAISADMAIRLAKAFDTTPQFWMNLQTSYDLWLLRNKKQPKIEMLVASSS